MLERASSSIASKSIDFLSTNRFANQAINSKISHCLIDRYVTTKYANLLQDPTDDNILSCAKRLNRLMKTVIPDFENRVHESDILNRIIGEFERAKTTGEDTSFTNRIKRTLSLMSKRNLHTVLVDFGAINFGIGKLNEKLTEEPRIAEFAMQSIAKCNGTCRECYAKRDKGHLDYETQERLIREARDLGARFTIILGGEPLLDKKNLLKLFHKFRRMPFVVATNGILLDENYAKEVAHLGNVLTLINIPGLEAKASEFRQNPQGWEQIKRAMENLKKYGAAAGFSSTVCSDNFSELSSEEFIEQMMSFNALIGFFFANGNPFACYEETKYRMTPQMNQEFSQRIKDASSRFPLILVDTTNNAEEKIGGCPAASKARLLYVRKGDNEEGQEDNCFSVETCPMGPPNVDKVTSLKEALGGRYLNALRSSGAHCVKSSVFIEELKKQNLV